MSAPEKNEAYGLLRLPNDLAHDAFLHYVGIPNIRRTSSAFSRHNDNSSRSSRPSLPLVTSSTSSTTSPSATTSDPTTAATVADSPPLSSAAPPPNTHYLLYSGTFFRFHSLSSVSDLLITSPTQKAQFRFSTILIPFLAYNAYVTPSKLESEVAQLEKFYSALSASFAGSNGDSSPPPLILNVWLVGIRSGVLGRRFLGEKLWGLRGALVKIEDARLRQVRSMLERVLRSVRQKGRSSRQQKRGGGGGGVSVVSAGASASASFRLRFLVVGSRASARARGRGEEGSRRAFFACMEAILRGNRMPVPVPVPQPRAATTAVVVGNTGPGGVVRNKPVRTGKVISASTSLRSLRSQQRKRRAAGGGGNRPRPKRIMSREKALAQALLGSSGSGSEQKTRSLAVGVPKKKKTTSKEEDWEKKALVARILQKRVSSSNSSAAASAASAPAPPPVPQQQQQKPPSQDAPPVVPPVEEEDDFSALISRMQRRFEFVDTLDTNVRRRCGLVLNRFSDLRSGKKKGSLSTLQGTAKQTLDSGTRVLGKLGMAVDRLGDERVMGLFRILEKVVSLREKYLVEFSGLQKRVRGEMDVLESSLVAPEDARLLEYRTLYALMRKKKNELIESRVLLSLASDNHQDRAQVHALESEIEGMLSHLSKLANRLLDSCGSLESYRTAVESKLHEIRKGTASTSSLVNLNLCPLSKRRLSDPVILLETATTYERGPIEEWLSRSDVDPVTKKGLSDKTLVPNVNLREYLREEAMRQREVEEEEELEGGGGVIDESSVGQ